MRALSLGFALAFGLGLAFGFGLALLLGLSLWPGSTESRASGAGLCSSMRPVLPVRHAWQYSEQHNYQQRTPGGSGTCSISAS